MATERLNVMVPVEIKGKEGAPPKTKWIKVGVAFPNRMEGFNVNLDFPIGVQRFVIMPQNDEGAPRKERHDDDDDLPGRH